MTSTNPNPHGAETTPRRTKARKARKVALAGLAVGVAGVATLGLAPAANAQQSAWVTITPGSTVCVQQYASYQVRGDGSANRPVKFRLKKNGVTISPDSREHLLGAGVPQQLGHLPRRRRLPGLRLQQRHPERDGPDPASHRLRVLRGALLNNH